MYEIEYDHQKHQFPSEAEAHSFLEVELGFKKKADYDAFYLEFTKTPSGTGMSPKMYDLVASLPGELVDLLSQLRKTEWATANREAREAWEQKQAAQAEAQQKPFREQQEKELEAIRADEMSRWLVDHPSASEADFQKIWPTRLALLEKEWRRQYQQDRLNQLRANGGY